MFNLEVLQKVISDNNIPSNTLILSDTGSEMGSCGITHIFYNETHNVLMLTSNGPYDGTFTDLESPVIYEFIYADDFDYDLCEELTWEYLDKFSCGKCCSYCKQKDSCTDGDKAICLKKFNDKEGYYEVQFKRLNKTYSGWTKWKLLWYESH